MRAVVIAAMAAALSAGALADTVIVKYRGPVDLAGFDCRAQPSSLVYRTCFDARHQYLIVNLKGVNYHYCRMPANVVAEWRNADSLGRYYLANVKGQYDCRLGGVPE